MDAKFKPGDSVCLVPTAETNEHPQDKNTGFVVHVADDGMVVVQFFSHRNRYKPDQLKRI